MKKKYLLTLMILILFPVILSMIISPKVILLGNYFNGNDIAFLEKSKYSNLKLIDNNGLRVNSINIIVLESREIDFFKKEYSQITSLQINRISDLSWSMDGEAIGLLLGTDYMSVAKPIIVDINGDILSCDDEFLTTNFLYPIQVVDDERLVINVGNYPDNYLSLYNMKECKQESVYYDGNGEQTFAISSTNWLALFEGNIDDLKFRVYDNQRTLVFETDAEIYDFIRWSKDGNKVVYRLFKSKEYDTFMIYDVHNQTNEVLGNNIYGASFAPNGDKILLEKIDGIYILDLTSAEQKYLINGTRPDWRP